MPDLIELSKDQILMGFVASCVEDVAKHLGVDPEKVYQRMDAVGMIDEYLIPFYDTLHTESRENLTNSLITSLKRWEEEKRWNYFTGQTNALKRLAEHQPNHQMAFLNQTLIDKYLTFVGTIELWAKEAQL